MITTAVLIGFLIYHLLDEDKTCGSQNTNNQVPSEQSQNQGETNYAQILDEINQKLNNKEEDCGCK